VSAKSVRATHVTMVTRIFRTGVGRTRTGNHQAGHCHAFLLVGIKLLPVVHKHDAVTAAAVHWMNPWRSDGEEQLRDVDDLVERHVVAGT